LEDIAKDVSEAMSGLFEETGAQGRRSPGNATTTTTNRPHATAGDAQNTTGTGATRRQQDTKSEVIVSGQLVGEVIAASPTLQKRGVSERGFYALVAIAEKCHPHTRQDRPQPSRLRSPRRFTYTTGA
jgi:hypothetical protein